MEIDTLQMVFMEIERAESSNISMNQSFSNTRVGVGEFKGLLEWEFIIGYCYIYIDTKLVS